MQLSVLAAAVRHLARAPPLFPPPLRQSEFIGTSRVKIKEAAQATTAAPTFYNPTIIGMRAVVAVAARV